MAISQLDVAETIEAFIRTTFQVMSDDPNFSREIHLFENGYVDSAGVVELIAFIESTFGVKLEDEHIFDENFTTITGISNILRRCMAR